MHIEEADDKALLTAMDEGVAAATPEPVVPEPETAPPSGPPEPEKLEAAPDAKPDAAPPAAEPKPDDTETEIKSLGLKEQSAARFRELAGTVKELAPIREQLTAANIKLEDLPRVIERAEAANDLIAQVMDTGATQEQYRQALDYLAAVNAGAKGDRASAEKAYEMMQGELQVLARALGKEVPGVHDPLAEHKDLADAVEAGDLTRKHALEIAQSRVTTTLAKAGQEQVAQQQKQEQEAAAATSQIAALDAHFLANDPHYLVRRGALSDRVAEIKAQLPPSQWAAATQRAYQQLAMIPVAVAPTPPAPPPVGPVRAGPRPPPVAPTFDDPLEALNFGIKHA